MLEKAFDRKPRLDYDGLDESLDSPAQLALAKRGFWQRIRRVNWSLTLGLMVLLLVAGVAVAGPGLAPRDPMEQNAIVRVGDGWHKPPFQTFEVQGFPLGTDYFGRDLFSRLLWAIRPTMTLVAIAAAVRLVLGASIGLGSGWFNGWLGRALNAAIAGALSVPVLMVALAAIAALGADLGLTAFVIGLALTGWADTAQLVREQTRIIKGKLYVEAAHALGAPGGQVLLRHVLRQVMPMLWMLFAFEISGTMMVVAGLAFLGYYIGGDIWVDVEDWVARRISGDPELGEMLATASQNVFGHPDAMLVVGGVIFIIVLSFNLLGQGLRARLSLMQIGRDTRTSRISRRVNLLFTECIILPIDRLSEKQKFAVAGLSFLVLLTGAGLAWQRVQAANTIKLSDHSAVQVPGDHLWTGAYHDPYGTRWVSGIGPETSDVQWVFHDPSGFPGGPAISRDGVVYIASSGGTLYALAPDGDYWSTQLPAAAVGAPGLDAQSNIYVTDETGGLSALTPSGELSWYFEPQESKMPMSGPVVAADGTVYYPLGNDMQAVSPEGQLLWKTQAPFVYRTSSPLLDPQGALLFWEEVVFDAHDGSLKEYPALREALAGAEQHYFVGADGRTYLYAGNNYMRVRLSDAGAQIFESVTSRENVGGIPEAMGVTPGGEVWTFYSKSFGGSRGANTSIYWKDLSGKILGNSDYGYESYAEMIAIDRNNTTYICGVHFTGEVGCVAFELGAEEPLWSLEFGFEGAMAGGALVPDPDGQPGRLYVALEGGYLYALGPGLPDAVPAGLEESVPVQIAQAAEPDQVTPTPTPQTEPVTATIPVETPVATDVTASEVPPTPTKQVMSGQPYTYTLVVANDGPSNATGVIVTDTLPAGVTFDSAVASQGYGCAYYWPNLVACYLGSLPNGSSATITITVTPAAELTGVLTNTAVVVANQFDPEETDNALSEQTPVEATADLALSRSSLPGAVMAGDVLTYTLTVVNNGPADATHIGITDMLAERVRIRSFTPVSGTNCTVITKEVWTSGAPVLVCDLSALPKGASATVTNVVEIGALARGVIDYTAHVTAREPDPNQANDIAESSVLVIAEADLAVDLTVAGPAVAGEALTYTVSLTNAGPADAVGLVVTDVLPLGATFVRTDPAVCREITGALVCELEFLGSGDVLKINLVLIVSPAATDQIDNRVTVGSRETDPAPLDNAAQTWTPVETRADLSITIGVPKPPAQPQPADLAVTMFSSGPARAGETLTYTLTITNYGPAKATGVILTDTLPMGWVFAGSPACEMLSDTLTCDLGELEGGQVIAFDVVVTLSSWLTQTGMVTNTVGVWANQFDPDGDNNRATAPTPVNPETAQP